MKKFWTSVKTSWPIWGAFIVFFILIGSMAAFSADWDRSFPLDYGPPGDTRTEMLNKLDEQADETFVHLNTLKANFAGDTAPTNPSQGQVWYDTINSTLKVFEASTWISAYSYSSAEFTWLGELADTASFATTQLNVVNATIDNLEASTISAPYATLTDIDVVSAEIGSATVGTLTTSNWSQNTATFNTLSIYSAIKYDYNEILVSTGSAGNAMTIGANDNKNVVFDIELVDDLGYHDTTTNPYRFEVPTQNSDIDGVAMYIDCGVSHASHSTFQPGYVRIIPNSAAGMSIRYGGATYRTGDAVQSYNVSYPPIIGGVFWFDTYGAGAATYWVAAEFRNDTGKEMRASCNARLEYHYK